LTPVLGEVWGDCATAVCGIDAPVSWWSNIVVLYLYVCVCGGEIKFALWGNEIFSTTPTKTHL